MTRQTLLDDIDLRYRNSYTTAQKLVWANDVERDLFDIFEIDAAPYQFTTVADQYLYPIPSEIDIEKIKVVTYDRNGSGDYETLHFKRNDDYVDANERGYWYTIVENNFYMNVPGDMPADRKIYVYHDKKPTEWSTSNLSTEPDTPNRFQDILKLGILESIAGARKDVIMKNNFSTERQQKTEEELWNMKQAPEFYSPADAMPKISHGYGRDWEYNFKYR